MGLLNEIFPCITARAKVNVPVHTNEDKPITDLKSPPAQPTEEEIATSIISALFAAEKPGHDLERTLQDIVHSCGWYEGLAKRVLDLLENTIKCGKDMVGAMKEADDKAAAEASDFVHEHPILTDVIITVIAIGILVILAPWAVEALGFGELGPIEGTFAAWWQSTFPDVEAGSLFGYFQRLGMKWGKK
ncbi:hypothetical protein AOQ84DRAFT_342164 [Glonium stellatum]|uniref:Lincomycin-condensing protein lmbA n=1 Tax=Glonium stellatum TaxID=574774 RepID=A0A8E2EZG0_9PEZI|nr:hypothetical protein AOQ84DRAFT_342164 [Glonium stellatum]